MIRKIVDIFTSLRLTVTLLCLAGILVFIGTLAQVKLGLYIVQADYFQNFFIWWQSKNGKISLPVFPGGYLLGSLLLINLIAAHIKRFDFSSKKMGITITHAGLILLLIGQLITELYQVETAMRIPEGESRNYSESPRLSELVIIDSSDEKSDKVVSFPTHHLKNQKELSHADLPFKLIVKDYYQNSEPRLQRAESGGGSVIFTNTARAVKMDDRDIPYAQVQIETDEGPKGPFTVSNWLTEDPLIDSIRRNFDSLDPEFSKQPSFTYKGREYKLMMRPIRLYKPYSIELIDFTHEKYRGTEIPKNFSSRVKILNPQSGENREVLIYMNNPLRYGGETYYQGSFERGDKVSILQVVRNPGWITPYVACTMVGVGLLIQFMSHLIRFTKKRNA
ncbi:MAG: cytochrome c biogenesis protein ResB [Verrucomicrobiales bacterium]